MNTSKTVISVKSPSVLTKPATGFLNSINQWFKNVNTGSEFTSIYLLRNKDEVVKPFLDSLETPYLNLSPELIFVEVSSSIEAKLDKLQFYTLASVCPKDKTYKTVLGKTEALFVDRIYQKDYNIELFLVEPSDWHNIRLTVAICKDLPIKQGRYFDTFIKIYAKLKFFQLA